MNITPITFAAALAAGIVNAQVTVDVSALTPLTANASVAGTTNTQTLPAGALPGFVSLATSPLAGASASYVHSTYSASFVAGCNIDFDVQLGAVPTGSSSAIGPQELLVELFAPTAIPVSLGVDYFDFTLAGSPLPTVDVDVGNDGSIDYRNGVPVPLSATPTVVGPQPLQLRIVLDAGLVASGRVKGTLRLEARPLNSIVVNRSVIGCFNSNLVLLRPTFVNRGIEVASESGLPQPVLIVVGWSPQPVLLPSLFTTPCLLLPAPDVIVPRDLALPLQIDLPQAVRPATFWLQTVSLTNGQVATQDGFEVRAL